MTQPVVAKFSLDLVIEEARRRQQTLRFDGEMGEVMNALVNTFIGYVGETPAAHTRRGRRRLNVRSRWFLITFACGGSSLSQPLTRS